MRPALTGLFAFAACGTPQTGDDSSAAQCTDVFFADTDGDGHGDLAAPKTACSLPSGYATAGDDCDDANPEVHPGADEVCDALDDDCDAAIDEDAIDASTWYADTDADEFGDGDATTSACTPPPGFVGTDGDCADDDRNVHPDADELCNEIDDDCDGLVDSLDPGLVQGTVWYEDDDGDGYGDPATGAHACEAPVGKVTDASDCDDSADNLHPGARETCDDVDNDCDGLADGEDDGLVGGIEFYADADGDGLGDAEVAVSDCAPLSGYVSDDQDCDDTDPKLGLALDYRWDWDGDGYGSPPVTHTCDPASDMVLTGGDCAPWHADTHPGGVEVCDDRDNNCDGLVDEDDPLIVYPTFYADTDGDGYGDPGSTKTACDAGSGFVVDALDCDDGDASIHPGSVEYCDGIDNDCDGTTDGSVVYADWYADDDGDGYGDPHDAMNDCAQPSGYVALARDCDDKAATTHPDAEEVCANGVDEDCDSYVDECGVAAADADVRVEGITYNWAFGSDIEVADADADGVADALLPAYDNAGAVYILYGPTSGMWSSSTLVALGTSTSDADFGFGVDGGDANYDGADDIVVGAPGSPVEAAYVFLGPVTGNRDATAADASLYGPAGSRTGAATNIVPDFDGDGGADLVIGAVDASSDRGAVYVASGASSGTVDLETDSTHVYEGGTAGDEVGCRTVSLGDTNGDGIADLAIDAREPGASDRGSVYVVEGGVASGTYAVDAAASAVVKGEPDSDFGYALAGPDYDADGTTDLLVGAFRASWRGSDQKGAVYAFLGPLSGSVDARDATTTWAPDSDVDYLGIDLAVGDVDGDKNVDVFMGAFWAAEFDGAAFLQFGLASGTVEVSTLPAVRGDFEGLGRSTALIPDWTGDEGDELAVGAGGTWNAAGDQVGAVYVVFSDGLHY